MLLCDIKNGDVYEREVSGLAMISLYVSDDWDFTRHLNDPWYMNLLEEDIPSFIAGEGKPYHLEGSTFVDWHLFSFTQTE